jgi:hypothetical protein
MYEPRDIISITLDNPVADHQCRFSDDFKVYEVDAANDVICTGLETGVEIALSANGEIVTLLSSAEDHLTGGHAGTRWPVRRVVAD